MPAGEHVLAVVIGHRAHAGDAHVAGYQHSGNGIAGFERCLPIGCGFGVAQSTGGPAAGHRGESGLLESGCELSERIGAESGEGQRRFDGHQLRKRADGCIGGAVMILFAGSARLGGPRIVVLVDLEHQLDRRDAADGVRREHTQPQRNRANQLAVDVHRAAAHAAGDVSAYRLAAHFTQDDVLVRPPEVLLDAQDLDGHSFRLGAGEHRPGHALHAGAHFGLSHDDWFADARPDGGGGGWGRDYGRCKRRHRAYEHGNSLNHWAHPRERYTFARELPLTVSRYYIGFFGALRYWMRPGGVRVAANWERDLSPDPTRYRREYWPMPGASRELAPPEERPEHLNLPAEAWRSRPAQADNL